VVVVIVVVVAIVPVVMIVVMIDDRGRRRLVFRIPLVDAEHAFHAADDTADCTADDRAERTGDAITFVEAVSSATGHATRSLLRLCGEWKSEGRETGCDEQFHFHVVSLIPSVSDALRPMTAQQGY
jgi:hypothetical protein